MDLHETGDRSMVAWVTKVKRSKSSSTLIASSQRKRRAILYTMDNFAFCKCNFMFSRTNEHKFRNLWILSSPGSWPYVVRSAYPQNCTPNSNVTKVVYSATLMKNDNIVLHMFYVETLHWKWLVSCISLLILHSLGHLFG